MQKIIIFLLLILTLLIGCNKKNISPELYDLEWNEKYCESKNFEEFSNCNIQKNQCCLPKDRLDFYISNFKKNNQHYGIAYGIPYTTYTYKKHIIQ